MALNALNKMYEAEEILERNIGTVDVNELFSIVDKMGDVAVLSQEIKRKVSKELKSRYKPILLMSLGEGWQETEPRKPFMLFLRDSSEPRKGIQVKLTKERIKIAPVYHGERVNKYCSTKPIVLAASYEKLAEELTIAIQHLNGLFSDIDSYFKDRAFATVVEYVNHVRLGANK